MNTTIVLPNIFKERCLQMIFAKSMQIHNPYFKDLYTRVYTVENVVIDSASCKVAWLQLAKKIRLSKITQPYSRLRKLFSSVLMALSSMSVNSIDFSCIWSWIFIL